MPECKICQKELIPTKELGYLHPSPKDGEGSCSEWDGIFIDQETRIQWNIKYGYPDHTYNELLIIIDDRDKKINNLLEEETKWNQQKQKLSKEIQELKTNLQKQKTLVEQLQPKPKWHKYKKIMKKWLTKKT